MEICLWIPFSLLTLSLIQCTCPFTIEYFTNLACYTSPYSCYREKHICKIFLKFRSSYFRILKKCFLYTVSSYWANDNMDFTIITICLVLKYYRNIYWDMNNVLFKVLRLYFYEKLFRICPYKVNFLIPYIW